MCYNIAVRASPVVSFLAQMYKSPATQALFASNSNAAVVISLSLAIILLSALFQLPRPLAISSLPWKVEFLASVFVIVLMIWINRKSGKEMNEIPAFQDRSVVIIVSGMSAILVWSGVSVFWAQSSGAVAHHTLTWSIYLSVLLISLYLFRAEMGYAVIVRTFYLVTVILGTLCLIDYLAITDFALSEGQIRIRYGKYAELLACLSPFLCVWMLFLRKNKALAFAVIVWLLGWLTVMLSLSKGAFLAGILGHLVLFAGCVFFSKPGIRRKTAALAALWLTATVILQVLFSTVSSIPSTTDYITGAADRTRSTTTMRTFTWSVGLQMASRNWLTGVGADNFGIAFNRARADYALNVPNINTAEIIAEDVIVERAHNEFLQVFAELGIIGILLFAAVFSVFGFMVFGRLRHNKYVLSPVLWASVAGMTAFFASSFVSSFSFRAIQNGIVFFLIFAIAINETVKMQKDGRENVPRIANTRWPKPLTAVCVVCATLMLIYCGTKFVAEYYVYQAERTAEFDLADKRYRTALRFDPDNASAYYFVGFRHAGKEDYKTAAALLREGIDRGLGVSLTYSLLAKYQMLAGDTDAAEYSLTEAIGIFPNSVFLRVRYAIFLEETRKPDDAARQLEIAKSIDARHANGWHSLIKNGSTAAFYDALRDPGMAPPAELFPDNVVRHYLDKTSDME